MARKYGFMRLADLADDRVLDVDVETLDTVLQEVTAEHLQLVAALESAWVEVTDKYKTRYDLPEGGTLQPLGENGEPMPGKETGHYNVEIPIKTAGDAWGAGRVTIEHMTVAEAERQTNRILRNDANWIRRHIIAAILTEDEYVFEDEMWGDLTITPLANGDAVVYVKEGVDDPETDDHYYAQAAAIADAANPFPTIYNELAEHPSNMVDESNPVVVYIATSLKASVVGLTDFYPIANGLVQLGSNSSVATDVENIAPFGSVLGVVNTDGTTCVVVEWKTLPAGYAIAHATGAGPFVYHREYQPASLKGFLMETPAVNGTGLRKRQWIRHAGFAVSNRIAAMGIYIGGGAWVNPTNFTAPLKK